MTLNDLFGPDAAVDAAYTGVAVSGLAIDSRAVKPGDVFVALAGAKADGAAFIAQAIANGAAAIAGDRVPPGDIGVPFAYLENSRQAVAHAAARLYPRQPPIVAAVTGTSGKTSVAAFTRQIWRHLGFEAASIGTIGLVTPRREEYGSLTTPDPIALHRTIDEITGEGVTHLALEASSHGLDQHRLDGVRIAAAGFTNLTRDHMDYHPDVAHYLDAKLRLFRDLVPEGGAAVICADHDAARAVIEASQLRGLHVMPVGRGAVGDNAIRMLDAKVEGLAQRLVLHFRGRQIHLALPLLGEFQIENALVAAGLAISTGSDAQDVFAALEYLEGASGRLEHVGTRNGAPIFIDYAHKPDALEKALQALRPYAPRQLVVVFGAGGDRDAGKRPLMGAIARNHADRVIVTDDNPRSENASAIRGAILATAKNAEEIADRSAAIFTAIEGLEPGDALLIAGKGHETGQIIGDRVLPFSDHAAVAAALSARSA